jgi:hypothetical protein
VRGGIFGTEKGEHAQLGMQLLLALPTRRFANDGGGQSALRRLAYSNRI